MRSTIEAKVTIMQAGKSYIKIALTDEDKHMIDRYSHKSYWNKLSWDTPHVRCLSDAGKAVRTAARRGEALKVGNDYFVRN